MEKDPTSASTAPPTTDAVTATAVRTNRSRNKKLARFGVLFAFLGLLLFAYFVRKAGISQIVDGIKRLGFGFLLILGISSIRQIARSLAWTRCFESPYRLRFRDAFVARVMGDALGNIVPLASVAVSEPSKAAFVTHRVPLMVSLAALALENIFYSLSVAIFIFSGTLALLLAFPLKPALRYASFGTLVVTLLIVPLGFFVIRKQLKFLSGALSVLHGRGLGRAWMEKTIPRARTLEDRIYGFYQRNGNRLLLILALEMCFHLAGVLEIYTTLWFISDIVAPTLLTAFILESVNRVINIVFKFIPFRLGVDEAGTGMLAKALGFTPAIGAALAIVRKARDLFWTAIGVGLIVRRGLSLKNLDKVGESEATLAKAAP
ncbi:MAG TPA: lysylphosphatidylglycerol synthase transmembrane domain-containing protein [Pyrinomonadaceae bacterium]|nr:lysylphosphatidylglycerol synthase transmembrane domain-containing protein [Pyrinomonadaceae bacterium]